MQTTDLPASAASLFSHVTAEKTAVYRAVMEIFAAAKRQFRLHLRPVYYEAEWTDGAVRRLARSAGDDIWLLLELARADVGASSYPHPEKIDALRRRLELLLAERPDRFTLPVGGEDIMAVLGLTPGPEVGRVKAELEDLVLDGVLPPDRDALLEHLKGRSRIS